MGYYYREPNISKMKNYKNEPLDYYNGAYLVFIQTML